MEGVGLNPERLEVAKKGDGMKAFFSFYTGEALPTVKTGSSQTYQNKI